MGKTRTTFKPYQEEFRCIFLLWIVYYICYIIAEGFLRQLLIFTEAVPIIHTVILQSAKNLFLSFQVKKTKKRDPSTLRPQDDKERSNVVILSVSEESHFFLFLKEEILQSNGFGMTRKGKLTRIFKFLLRVFQNSRKLTFPCRPKAVAEGSPLLIF